MIVGSLLLILVAVTLLVFGLAGGSSPLLIASIVASLLAAVALVIGARQAAGRAVVGDDALLDPRADPGMEPDGRRYAMVTGMNRPARADPAADVLAGAPAAGVGPVDADEPGFTAAPPPRRSTDFPADAAGVPADTASASYAADAASGGPAPATGRGSADADTDARGFRPAGATGDLGADDAADAAAGRQDSVTFQTAGDDLHDSRGDARGARDEAASAGGGSAPGQRVADSDEPASGAGRRHGWTGTTTPADDPDGGGFPHGALADVDPGLDRPADEDPADEPAPQKVFPADAAQLARSTVEVLVVDGRPRYHLVGCPHLSGRESEPVPVAEAIDLGFTPCGRCRPVDRLVVAARPF